MKYKVTEKYFNPIVIEFEKLGFIEMYKNGIMYTNIQFNGNIKTIRKILRIANKERIKAIFRKR